jgi:hypothetical protein
MSDDFMSPHLEQKRSGSDRLPPTNGVTALGTAFIKSARNRSEEPSLFKAAGAQLQQEGQWLPQLISKPIGVVH